MKPNWDDIVRALDEYSCRCGSGGSMACDDDCPGDNADHQAREAIKVIIAVLRELEARR
jgi:hypothetical protein